MLAVNGVSYTQLGEYVEQKNRWQAIFKAPEITFPLSQATADHLMEGIASALSPENLGCDGELSSRQVRAKARELNAVKAELEQYCLNNWLDTPVCSYQGLTSSVQVLYCKYIKQTQGALHMTTINLTTTDLDLYTVEDLQTIMAAAKTAAYDAATAHIDTYGERGYCGFAWVNIHGIKGNTKLGKRMKAAGYEKDYSGAYSIWNPSSLGTQCMSTKEEGAQAAAKVFKACGFTAYAGSRAD